jgi:hypothetical protein
MSDDTGDSVLPGDAGQACRKGGAEWLCPVLVMRVYGEENLFRRNFAMLETVWWLLWPLRR